MLCRLLYPYLGLLTAFGFGAFSNALKDDLAPIKTSQAELQRDIQVLGIEMTKVKGKLHVLSNTQMGQLKK